MSIIYLLNNYVNTFYTFMKKFLITVAVTFFSLRKDLFRDTIYDFYISPIDNINCTTDI